MVKFQEDNPLFEVKHLKKYFPLKKISFGQQSYVKAVDDVSFSISKGMTLGLAGESGCGKTTLIRSILRLTEPTAGTVHFSGKELTALSKSQVKRERQNMQIVFQDPFASLPPKMKVGKILLEPLIINRIGGKAERLQMVEEIIKRVGLEPEHLNRYPFEFSGGQRQRVVIARALVMNPQLLILDEPVSALDVSIQSQILNLLEELQKSLDLTYLFISHDLAVVEHICDYIMIMYLGKVMEIGRRDDIFLSPRHPYTRGLLAAIPAIEPEKRRDRVILEGEIPSPVNPPTGCVFKTRCPCRMDKCDLAPPCTIEGEHQVYCHLYG